MITQEDIVAWQKARDEFAKTTIGAAFYKFKNAYHDAITKDVEDSFNEKSRPSTKKALEEAVAAEKHLLEVLHMAAELIKEVK